MVHREIPEKAPTPDVHAGGTDASHPDFSSARLPMERQKVESPVASVAAPEGGWNFASVREVSKQLPAPEAIPGVNDAMKTVFGRLEEPATYPNSFLKGLGTSSSTEPNFSSVYKGTAASSKDNLYAMSASLDKMLKSAS